MHSETVQNSKQVITSHEQRMTQALMQQRKNISKVNKAIKYLDSKDPSVIIKGLNVLTVKTYDTSDSNIIHLETFPELILSLGCLLNDISPWSTLVESKLLDNFADLILNHSEPWKSIEMPVDTTRLKVRIIVSCGNFSYICLVKFNE